MAASIKNQATLTYAYGESTGRATSNVASAVLEGPLSLTKSAVDLSYRANDVITHTLIMKNTGNTTLTNVKLVDDLGTYAISETVEVTPLTYVGPSQLYTNDTYTSVITPTISAEEDEITFTIASVPALTTIMILYKAKVNQYANLNPGISSIENAVYVTATGLSAPATASHTIRSDSYALVEIEKTMSPNPIMDGSVVTYTFEIRNYGNQQANNIILQDVFDTISLPEDLNVMINGTPFTEFDYTNGVLLLPGLTSSYNFSIPAADITQDAITGEVTVTPASATVIVTGTM